MASPTTTTQPTSSHSADRHGSLPVRAKHATVPVSQGASPVRSSSMDTIRDILKEHDFPDAVVEMVTDPSRDSSSHVYNAQWKAFAKWANDKGIPSRDLSYITLAEYLVHLFAENKQVNTVKCHYNACHYSANASLTRSILGSQTAPTSWHALMTVPEWLSTWAKGVKSSRSDRPQRQWHLFVPIQLEQNKRIPPAGHVNTVDSWLIFDQTHWLFISDALRMPPFGQYGC